MPEAVGGVKCMGRMVEFAGLRAKQYGYRKVLELPAAPAAATPAAPAGAAAHTDQQPQGQPQQQTLPPQQQGKEVLRCKGLAKQVVKSSLRFEDYKSLARVSAQEVLDGAAPTHQRHTMFTLRSRQHQLLLEGLTKRSLCSFDDKRYVLPCGIHTVAWGHAAVIRHAEETGGCPLCADPASWAC